MLIRFGLQNWRSVREFQEISFVASAYKDAGTDPIVLRNFGERLLPCSAIYGANASGKSNLLRGLMFLRHFVRHSHARGGPETPIDVEPFLLDGASAGEPTQFLIDFILDETRFEYCVVLNSTEVIEERLVAYPKKRPALWYERKNQGYVFGKSLRGENRVVESVTRPNSLFLSAGATLNHAQLSSVYSFFRDGIAIASDSISPVQSAPAKFLLDPARKQRIIGLLRAADVGICDIDVEKIEPTEKDRAFQHEINAVLRKHFSEAKSVIEAEQTADPPVLHRLRFTHSGAKSDVTLGLENESKGTQRLLALLSPALKALEVGQVLIIDELDTSLHPLLARQLIRLFQDTATNVNHAQLVFTTHDANLLSRQLLRRDQIWFAEKSNAGATTIYPLSDVKTRPTDNIERGYLEGRFGAIPFIGEFRDLFQDTA